MLGFAAASCALALGVPQWASAQGAWPTKTVRIVVPFAAGGTTDVVARAVAKDLSEMWGQSVVVENRGGAGGNIGADVVAKSAPDGYTLLMTSGSIFTVNPHMYAKMPFDAKKDFIAVTNVASGPQLVVVNPSVPAKTLKEFIAYAKTQQGKLNFGSAGVGSQVHMAAESFLDAAGIDLAHIPYKGEGPSYTDLVSGSIQLMVGNIAAAAPFVANGRLRALAVTSRTRSSLLPDVPTVAESGLAGFENTGWFGFMLPAGTPKAIVDKVHRDTVKVLDQTEMKARLFVQGMTPVGNSPTDFSRAIDRESAHWAKVVERRKLKAN
ncbi:MAG: tripartite tricarboxylate transporter substrate binding protein [Burkholderiales bacterium]|nr:MAG: tripartite tricarboxylate transporter substrate binding protein [Burkholderiales bacterium]RPH66510.1 MAG: tripartite tricarboxylate transporter substrate binding protein [Burkholderiales bacterium]